MKTHRIRFWTGPVHVTAIGQKATDAGFTVCVGTEHLLIDSKGIDALDARLRVLDAMKATHGKAFGLR